MRETAADAAHRVDPQSWGYLSEHLGPSPTAWGFLAVWQPGSKSKLAGDPRLTHFPGGGTVGLVYQWECVTITLYEGPAWKIVSATPMETRLTPVLLVFNCFF